MKSFPFNFMKVLGDRSKHYTALKPNSFQKKATEIEWTLIRNTGHESLKIRNKQKYLVNRYNYYYKSDY